MGIYDCIQPVWEQPVKPEYIFENNGTKAESKSLPFVNMGNDLTDERYCLFGHGTTTEAGCKIMNGGLLVGDKSGYLARDTGLTSNFINLTHIEPNELKKRLDKWKHKNYNTIILYRVPIKYLINMGNWDNPSTVAVGYHNDNDPNHLYSGVYEKEFIYGKYDAETGQIQLNDNYHGNLDNKKDTEFMETVYHQLKNDYDNHLKKQVVGKNKANANDERENDWW